MGARRAARIATAAGALALWDAAWRLLGLGDQVAPLGQWVAVALAFALLTGALAFGVAAAGTRE
ncbi:hypothetical protein [Streptomyces sp. NPDC004284]|uniref:hypothetical protein n=1 Tax=Streptomyces sp. NPDC004284 TaxID=3364695 RepID=UPI00369441E5